MRIHELLMLLFLIVCALSVCLLKNLLVSLIVFTSYSLVMSVLWVLLQSPDLAVTEAAVGAGVTSILFFATLHRIGILTEGHYDEEEK